MIPKPPRQPTESDKKEDYITYKNLCILLDMPKRILADKLKDMNISAEIIGYRRTLYFKRSEINIEEVKNRIILDSAKTCRNCLKKYHAKEKKEATITYCSDKCRKEGHAKAKEERKKKEKQVRKNMLKYEDKFSKKNKKKEMIKDIDKIMTCSIECILDELGDIE